MSHIAPKCSRPEPAHSMCSQDSLHLLLHALNQPVTGLQCSLELALAAAASPDRYQQVLQDGIDLVGRMRILVDGIREVIDFSQIQFSDGECALDLVIRENVSALLPIAENRNVHLRIRCQLRVLIPGNQSWWSQQVFRLMDSALSLAQEDSELLISLEQEPQYGCLTVSWEEAGGEVSGYGRLGLIVAQALCERAGAEWRDQKDDNRHTCSLIVPLKVENRIAEEVGR